MIELPRWSRTLPNLSVQSWSRTLPSPSLRWEPHGRRRATASLSTNTLASRLVSTGTAETNRSDAIDVNVWSLTNCPSYVPTWGLDRTAPTNGTIPLRIRRVSVGRLGPPVTAEPDLAPMELQEKCESAHPHRGYALSKPTALIAASVRRHFWYLTSGGFVEMHLPRAGDGYSCRRRDSVNEGPLVVNDRVNDFRRFRGLPPQPNLVATNLGPSNPERASRGQCAEARNIRQYHSHGDEGLRLPIGRNERANLRKVD